MKVLVANKFFYPRGGPETVMFQQAEHLTRMGHQVIPFAMQDQKNVPSGYEEYFVSPSDYRASNGSLLNGLQKGLRIIHSFESRNKISRLLDETRPDIAHLHNIYHQISPSILGELSKRNIPVVMTLHDFKLVCPNYSFYRDGALCEECQGRKFYKAVQHRCVQSSRLKSSICAVEGYWHKFWGTYTSQVDLFISLSQFANNKFCQYGLPGQRVITFPNSLDLSLYAPSPNHQKFVLFVGRLNQKYGIFTLLEAAQRLPDIQFQLAGNGEEEEKVRGLAKDRNLKNVQVLGFLPPEQLKEKIRQSYFTVFPVKLYHNCPMAVLEAFALGKPVIASNLGSIPEFVRHGYEGLLFETDSVRDLADKINELHGQPDLVRQLGRNARSRMEKDFSAQSYYPRLVQLYQDLIERKRVNHDN